MLWGVQTRTLTHYIRPYVQGYWAFPRGAGREIRSRALGSKTPSIACIRGRSPITNAASYETRVEALPSMTSRSNGSERRSTVNMVFYDFVRAEEVEDAWEIEKQGFPPEEADNLETLRFHQRAAPELFLGAYIPSSTRRRRLIAYIYGTLSSIPRYTQESLTTHTPGGTTVCGHTLCLDKEFRGASIGLKLFVDFVDMCKRRGIYDRMVMMAKENMVPVYERLGFMTIGKAEITFGKDAWYEMCMSFRDPEVAK